MLKYPADGFISLAFSAENLPSWARIDATSGEISGVPRAGDVGSYEDIAITVADAAGSATSDRFRITVLEAPAHVAIVRWDAPPSRFDGSPLDDLAGYRILYGRNADDLDHSTLISDATATSYEFDSLEGGIWYFAVVAVNAGGLEGPPTDAAMLSI